MEEWSPEKGTRSEADSESEHDADQDNCEEEEVDAEICSLTGLLFVVSITIQNYTSVWSVPLQFFLLRRGRESSALHFQNYSQRVWCKVSLQIPCIGIVKLDSTEKFNNIPDCTGFRIEYCHT